MTRSPARWRSLPTTERVDRRCEQNWEESAGKPYAARQPEQCDGPINQRRIRSLLNNADAMLATEPPRIDRLTDQLNTLSQHADETIQNVNGTVSEVRETIRKDVVELQSTLFEAKRLLADMQVLVKANDYKIDDTIENLDRNRKSG